MLLQVLLVALALLWATWLLERWHSAQPEHLTFFGFLTKVAPAIAVLVAGAWVLDRRDDAPKINIEGKAYAYALNQKLDLSSQIVDARCLLPNARKDLDQGLETRRGALILFDPVLLNVGVQPIDLSDLRYAVYIEAILPLSMDVLEEFRRGQERVGYLKAGQFSDATRWTLVSALDKGDVAMVSEESKCRVQEVMSPEHRSASNLVVEAGEAQELHFRIVVPCSTAKLYAISIEIPKQKRRVSMIENDRQALVWTGRAYVDVSEVCSGA